MPTLAYDRYLEEHRYKYLALYHAMRAAILDGGLPAGARLPPTRRLAVMFGLSRGSAAQVYDMLAADGYVRGETGRGTFVAGDADRRSGALPAGSGEEAGVSPGGGLRLSPWGQRLAASLAGMPGVAAEAAADPAADLISFRAGGADLSQFPVAGWRRALSDALGAGGAELAQTAPPQGDEGLRRAVAAHLRLARGISAEPSEIMLYRGSMQGIVELTALLLAPGEKAVTEDPGFPGIRRAVEAAGGIAVPGRVDRDGLVPGDWDARLVFVTPARQYPTGAVLPLSRRRRLLEWAAAVDGYIIEDDYDSEFRWSGRPIEPLKALDRHGRVLYIGSFSTSMFPGLRIGYAVLPPALVRPAAMARALPEPVPGGLLEQRALGRFMAQGGYLRHLRRMTRLYGARGLLLRSLLKERLGGVWEAAPGDAGLHVYARWLGSAEAYRRYGEAARRRGVDYADAARYRITPGEPAACFAFAHLDEEKLIEGTERLALAWSDVQNGR
ncbi:MocR-like pyridoxine biosynthesis transcription factor PdxR [Paenibacillus glufosinatiresistens]|uniref:MocR-like pyridoxine biosynthesis transcription factor PdxR n=1 Tax=Paenibacillus glufosinatiresistens TaxID=3070657 RepID=UPI00286E93A8|nr:PLP-dependent aminotransferase family protein [Paenibacillus sp. YX.27]